LDPVSRRDEPKSGAGGATPRRNRGVAARRMMDLAAYNAFCGSLPHTGHVVQWGGAHVWKVATKVFAIGRVHDDGALHVSYKCCGQRPISPLAA
jgi:hypothetical protein